MLAALLAHVALAGCEPVGLADIVGVDAPAVVVLGVRHGTQPDLYRASRAVWRLRQRAGVRLALDAVRPELQPVLDDYADRRIEPEDLEDALSWRSEWGFPFQPYARLLAHARHGVEVLGVAVDGERGRLEDVPVPQGYLEVLRDGMAGHEVPDEVADELVEHVAWHDHRLATQALAGWDRQGLLVIVADRLHVEGGRGVSWQVAQLVDVPVHAFTLAWSDGPCFDGDRVWRAGLLESLLERPAD